MTMISDTVINQIEDVRKSNNSLWMDLLRIAFDNDPDATKQILRKINTTMIL